GQRMASGHVQSCAGLVGTIVLSLLGPACQSKPREEPWWVKPPLQAATRFLKLGGTIDPKLDVRLDVLYSTGADSCRVVGNKLEGAYSDRMYRHVLELHRNGQEFETQAPLDLVDPGDCGWYPWGIEYVVLRDGKPHSVPIPPTPLFWLREREALDVLEPIQVRCVQRTFLVFHQLECDTPPGHYFLRPAPGSLTVSFGDAPGR